MSLHNRATAAVLAQLMMTADGALFGLGVAYVAYCSIRKYTATSSAVRKIRQAPSVELSDLRSVLSDGDDSSSSHKDDGDASSSNFEGGKLMIVRGIVEVKSAAEKGNWKSLRGTNLVVSQESGEKGVILQRSQTCIYNEWRGVFGWTADIRSMLTRSTREQESSSIRMVPFILVEGGKWPPSDYLVVNMEGSRHPLPLATVYQHLQPIEASPYTFLQALFGLEYPVGLLYEEKILPLGKDITAVGICNLKNGIPEIKSCKDLPYFLNWVKWKEWRHQRRSQQQNDSTNSQTPTEVAAEEDSGDVPDGELCVICLMRRRRSAFIPCGHLVCCQRCALAVEREVSPKCPVCRQSIRSSVRIYDS
ncbi:hypothetical protein DH2020_016272 [Rehmannia glutinosa]|uniref:RING-type E3 ubiquitin transferase n=1 Tax=Rehmannia glutinosa TaxID=99300 RepID=A0ABR0US66_REHGL